MAALFPLFLKLEGKKVVIVGGGPVAASKAQALLDAGAVLTVVAPAVVPELATRPGVRVVLRAFEPADLEGAWWVVAAAPGPVNRAVAEAAEERRVFVNAVDQPDAASAYMGGVVRRGGATLAISTDGAAPALAGLLREGLEAVLPDELDAWLGVARRAREQWKRDGVEMSRRRPLLLEALNSLYAVHPESSAAESKGQRPIEAKETHIPGSPVGSAFEKRLIDSTAPSAPLTMSGFVSLVGAGPGSADLLTLKGLSRLREADLVLYDALVSADVVALAPQAQRFPVGKRAGGVSFEQRTIEKLMIRAARRGKRVVRLKCGDPFVFGRGGEEGLALADAGIAFEVVPGVSSAIAAPALAGIPVTHRGLASGFTVVSGHAPSAYEPVVDSLAPLATTLVVLMGIGRRTGLVSRLLQRGWSPKTPAALILSASTPEQWTWVGTLEGLGAADAPEELPGTLVIGPVVSVAARLAPAEKEKHHVHG